MLQYAPYLPRCTFCSFLVYSVLLGQVVHFQTQNFTNTIIECMSNSSAQLTGFHIKCYINAKFEIVMMVIAFASIYLHILRTIEVNVHDWVIEYNEQTRMHCPSGDKHIYFACLIQWEHQKWKIKQWGSCCVHQKIVSRWVTHRHFQIDVIQNYIKMVTWYVIITDINISFKFWHIQCVCIQQYCVIE